MCVIISIYNNSKNNSKIDFLADNLSDFRYSNNDGTAFFGFDTNRETKNGYLRELTMDAREIFSDLLEKYNISHFHFRNSTQGYISKDNIHFWKHKNWIMAHNGQVFDYQRVPGISDSNMLFRDFINNKCFDKDCLDINKVNKIVSKLSFWGRLLIINTETKQAYYFGDFYLSVLDKNILVVSTTQLRRDTLILYGLAFQTDSKDIVQAKMDGIFRIDAKTQEFKKYKLEFNQKASLGINDYGATSLKEYESEWNSKKIKGMTRQEWLKI